MPAGWAAKYSQQVLAAGLNHFGHIKGKAGPAAGMFAHLPAIEPYGGIRTHALKNK